MKFIVTNDEQHKFDLEIEFSSHEKQNLTNCFYDVALGCSRIIIEMVRDCDSKEKAKKLASFLIDQITESVEECIEDYYNEKEANILEHSLYEFMEKTFYDWLDTLNESHEIFNEQDFIEACANKEVKLAYTLSNSDLSNSEVNIFISLNGEEKLDICSFSIALLEENENKFDAYCFSSECIATVAFDKLYGEEKNPLRNEKWNLTQEIKKAIQMRKIPAC